MEAVDVATLPFMAVVQHRAFVNLDPFIIIIQRQKSLWLLDKEWPGMHAEAMYAVIESEWMEKET